MLVNRLLPGMMLTVTLWAATGGDASCSGVLKTPDGVPVPRVLVELREVAGARKWTCILTKEDRLEFQALAAGRYSVAIQWRGRSVTSTATMDLSTGSSRAISLELSSNSGLLVHAPKAESTPTCGSGEQLSSSNVTGLPLNKRDFGQLLLLAGGTMTDTNGAANFTQQFAVNGQRGSSTVFAMDGIDTIPKWAAPLSPTSAALAEALILSSPSGANQLSW